MSEGFWRAALRDNWYLFAILAVIAAVCVALFLRDSGKAEAVAMQPAGGSSLAVTPEAVAEPAPARQTEEEKVRAMIADYQQKVDADPKDPDAPAYLNAMGNLSRQKLLDYKEAARCYELILVQYPAWEMISKVYPQLAACYERLGDRHNLEWVYKQMMEKFPPESPEYQYAQTQLGMPS